MGARYPMTPMEMLAFGAFIAAQLADVLTTVAAMKRGAVEANPIIRAMMDKLGGFWIPAKLLLATWVALWAWQAGSVWVVWAVAALTAAVAYRNTRIGK